MAMRWYANHNDHKFRQKTGIGVSRKLIRQGKELYSRKELESMTDTELAAVLVWCNV
jgi:hypothetical protein